MNRAEDLFRDTSPGTLVAVPTVLPWHTQVDREIARTGQEVNLCLLSSNLPMAIRDKHETVD